MQVNIEALRLEFEKICEAEDEDFDEEKFSAYVRMKKIFAEGNANVRERLGQLRTLVSKIDQAFSVIISIDTETPEGARTECIIISNKKSTMDTLLRIAQSAQGM